MQRSEINIHPLSDSDNSEEDDDFAPIHGTPDSSSAAPSYPLASNGGSHTADADPDRGRPSYVTSEREPQQLGTDRALDPAEPDDSLRIKDLDTGRELRFQQVLQCVAALLNATQLQAQRCCLETGEILVLPAIARCCMLARIRI